MSGLSEKIKTKQKVKTFTRERLSKISEEKETEMIAENAENTPVDMTEAISEDKTDDRVEDITEDIAVNGFEGHVEGRTEGGTDARAEARNLERADSITVDTPEGGVGERAQDEENNQIENIRMNPFGKLGTSIIIFLIFAGILSLIAIQIHSRAKNDFDDISAVFKFRSLLAATLRGHHQFENPAKYTKEISKFIFSLLA